MRFLTTILLIAAIYFLPLPESRAQENSFRHQILHHIHSKNTEALESEIRKEYGADVELSFIGERKQVTEDSVTIIPAAPHPDVMLGCVVIVIVVSATVLGGVVYIVVTKCNRAIDNMNPPPLHQGPTNFHPAHA